MSHICWLWNLKRLLRTRGSEFVMHIPEVLYNSLESLFTVSLRPLLDYEYIVTQRYEERT